MGNKTIRDAIAAAGLRHWEVADELGISEATFTRWLRKELPEDKKNTIMNAITTMRGVRTDG